MTRLSSVLLASLSSLSFAACAIDDVDVSSTDQAATGEQGLAGAPEPHDMPQRGQAGNPFGGGGTSSPLLTNTKGGPILVAAHTVAIFWGAEWGDGTNAFSGDKVSGLASFFGGFGGSTFANTNTEYTGGADASTQVTNGSVYDGALFDGNAAPRKAPSTSGLATEVCNVLNAQGRTPDPDTVYFVYTSSGAGHVSYCAWHSYGTCNGVKIQTAYMPNIDGLAGCDPGNPYGVPGSQGLRALANVTAHELSEAITDPHIDAWKDSSGSENADKCAWKWAGPVTFSNNTTWMLQMNWSNAAYNAGTGDGGVRGCIQTH